jgi:BTB/POZ domain
MSPSTSMAKIYVGEEMWHVHEAIICAKLDYFSKALQGGFKEARQKDVYLEEVDADALSLFMDWVYGNGRFFQYTNEQMNI